jgi:rubrerythrin
MYPSFAKTAVAEGYPAIASLFSAVAQIEKFHEQRYKQFEAQLKAKKSFVNPSETY